MRHLRLALVLALSVCQIAVSTAAESEHDKEKVLRVCQDPNNLPFSNEAEQGFENKIAALFAKELGWKLEHTWYPQRMGFIRNTLRAKVPDSEKYKCDLVTSAPEGFDLGATTSSYYRSTYAMVYVRGKGLDNIKTPDDLVKLDPEKRKSLKLGVFARSPVVDWLLRNGMVEQMVAYQPQTGDAAQYPGEIIEKDLANGKIDIAFAWGPIAGYFAKHASKPMEVVSLGDIPGFPLSYNIAMAVRFDDKALKNTINGLIQSHPKEIKAILDEYNVPQLDIKMSKAESGK